MLADVSDLPPAGAFRGRCLGPRELLARSGADVLSPPLHPKAWRRGSKWLLGEDLFISMRLCVKTEVFHVRKSLINSF